MKYSVLLLLIILGFVSACDSPTRSFNNANVNDPLSPRFKPRTNTDLQAQADTNGVITISWPEQIDIATKLILEKSLGDSLSYSPIAELSPETLVFRDSSLVVRQDTYYRLSSWAGATESQQVLIESSQAKLDIGELFNLELEFVEEENTVRLSWQTTFPLFTHFVISSDKILTEENENTIRIEAKGINHSFTDPLLDIGFHTRDYTVMAIIEHDETEEEISEAEISFDGKKFFRPTNLRLNILNEQDWLVAWNEAPFFATNVELIRRKEGKDDITFLLPAGAITKLDALFIRQADQSNETRQYFLRFQTEDTESEQVNITRRVTVQPPVINLTGSSQENSGLFTLSWEIHASSLSLVKEFVIEKRPTPDSQNFVEIGRVNGNIFEFTDAITNPEGIQTYRVRSLTSFPSDAATFVYSNHYEIDYAFPTQIQDVTSMETTSDGRFLAYVSFIGSSGNSNSNSIRIHDLDARQEFATISLPSHRIFDVKLSPDEQYIYFNVPDEGAIYRANFPSGDNVEMVIDDAYRFQAGVLRIDVSRDGSFIVGAGGGVFIKRWSLDTFEGVLLYANLSTTSTYPSKNVSISPDGSYIAYGGARPLILDAQTGELLEVLPTTNPNIADFYFSDDGSYFSYVNVPWSLAPVYSTQNWQRTEILSGANRIDFHPKDPILLIAGDFRTYTYNVETSQINGVVSDENGSGFTPFHTSPPHYIDQDKVALVKPSDNMFYIWKKSAIKGWKFVY